MIIPEELRRKIHKLQLGNKPTAAIGVSANAFRDMQCKVVCTSKFLVCNAHWDIQMPTNSAIAMPA
jgi:hypothetical protein